MYKASALVSVSLYFKKRTVSLTNIVNGTDCHYNIYAVNSTQFFYLNTQLLL